MYNERIYLTPKDILDKDFKIDARGYRPQEVDNFLDMIIHDYTAYNSNTKRLEKEVKDLLEENSNLKKEIRTLNEQLEISKNEAENNTHTLTNLDLLKRISQLEKAVFGKEE